MSTNEASDVKKTWPTQIWSSNQIKKEDAGAARPPTFLVQKVLSPEFWNLSYFFRRALSRSELGFEDKLKLVIKTLH